MILSIVDDFNDMIRSIKSWFLRNYSNPLLWIGIVVAFLVILGIAYSVMHERD